MDTIRGGWRRPFIRGDDEVVGGGVIVSVPAGIDYHARMAIFSRGFLYFAAVFAFAFVMGVVRTLFIAPRVGAVAAVAIELPIIIGVSFLVARRMLRGHALSLGERGAIGAIAFILLMIADATLSVVMRRESVAVWAANLVTPLGLLGLAGQIGFGLMPLFIGDEQAAGA